MHADPPGGRPRRGFDWNLLHTFLVIVQEQSISRAADRLLLCQPTVSNALKRLEDQLGKRLIERGSGRFEPTEHGIVLYRECQDICGTIGRLEQLMDESATEITGELHIHMASHVVFPPLDATLAAFHERYPKVSFDIEVATSASVIEAVRSKQASLGICLVSQPDPQLDFHELFREHFGFFCGPGHRLFGQSGLEVQDLRGESFVSFKTDRLADALRPVAVLRAQLQMYGHVVGTSSNLEEVRRMIVSGLGIGPLPIHVVERDVRQGLLWRLPPFDDPPAIAIYLVTNPRATLGRAEQLFIEMLIAQAGGRDSTPPTYPDGPVEALAGAGAADGVPGPGP